MSNRTEQPARTLEVAERRVQHQFAKDMDEAVPGWATVPVPEGRPIIVPMEEARRRKLASIYFQISTNSQSLLPSRSSKMAACSMTGMLVGFELQEGREITHLFEFVDFFRMQFALS